MTRYVHRIVQNACDGDQLPVILLVQAKQDQMPPLPPTASNMQCVEALMDVGAAPDSCDIWAISQRP
jgi:hypothetical protein